MVNEQTFAATLERGDRALGWTIAYLPFNPQTTWPDLIRLRVCGEISGPSGSVFFRTSLFAAPAEAVRNGFFLLVNSAMQQAAGVVLGQTATFHLRADREPRPAELPECLDALLEEAEGLRSWYNTLSEYSRRELGKWILGVKGEAAQLRRAQQTAERLLSTMEAEVELPPLFEQAFQRRPKARSGWARMTPGQRRTGLLAVFFYQTPDARERRLARLLDSAEHHGKKPKQ